MAPPAPDYATAAAWSAGPFGPGAAATVPAGATPAARLTAVDVFYVHPTTSKSREVWNQDIADAAENRWADESVVARQASVFNACCRVFSPRYRAATAKAFTSPAGRDAAFALAFSDIERAFDWYLAHENKGRPFIIAGHSQGAFHMATLLERRIDGTPLQRQMVAAYIIGINLAEGDFGRRFKVAKPCARPDDTGCVLQWQAILASSDVAKAAGYSQSTFVAKYGDVPGKQSLCLNPLTFDARRPAAPARARAGRSARRSRLRRGAPAAARQGRGALRTGPAGGRCRSRARTEAAARRLDALPRFRPVLRRHPRRRRAAGAGIPAAWACPPVKRLAAPGWRCWPLPLLGHGSVRRRRAQRLAAAR